MPRLQHYEDGGPTFGKQYAEELVHKIKVDKKKPKPMIKAAPRRSKSTAARGKVANRVKIGGRRPRKKKSAPRRKVHRRREGGGEDRGHGGEVEAREEDDARKDEEKPKIESAPRRSKSTGGAR